MGTGSLYLIPVPLGEGGDLNAVIPEQARRLAATLRTFVVEHPKTARQFLKQTGTAIPLQEIRMLTLDEHTRPEDLEALLQPLLAGEDVGLLSEAGCPAVADPGANLVRLAHSRNIRVMPLVGPSSILLALMASGLNGQSFAFLGYLPAEKTERVKRIAEIEQTSQRLDQTQIFIETPYRNQPVTSGSGTKLRCGNGAMCRLGSDTAIRTGDDEAHQRVEKKPAGLQQTAYGISALPPPLQG